MLLREGTFPCTEAGSVMSLILLGHSQSDVDLMLIPWIIDPGEPSTVQLRDTDQSGIGIETV